MLSSQKHANKPNQLTGGMLSIAEAQLKQMEEENSIKAKQLICNTEIAKIEAEKVDTKGGKMTIE